MRDDEDEDEDEDEDDQKTAARRPTWNALACAAMVVDEMFSSYYACARSLKRWFDKVFFSSAFL